MIIIKPEYNQVLCIVTQTVVYCHTPTDVQYLLHWLNEDDEKVSSELKDLLDGPKYLSTFYNSCHICSPEDLLRTRSGVSPHLSAHACGTQRESLRIRCVHKF